MHSAPVEAIAPMDKGGVDPAAMTHMPQSLALAKFPNLAVKPTGAPGYSSQTYPLAQMHPHRPRSAPTYCFGVGRVR